MNDKCMTLNVNDKPPITVYKNFAYLLCILCADSENSEWIHERFCNIYLIEDHNGYIWLDFLEPNDGFDSLLNFEYIPYEKLGGYNVIELIKSTIQDNKYVSIMLDEYYMSHTLFFGKTHCGSEFFIYGYDDDARSFYSIGFNSSKSFGKIIYSYDEVIKAFDSLVKERDKIDYFPPWVLWYTFGKITKLHTETGTDNIGNILNELEEYSSSTAMASKLRAEIIESRGNEAIYGVACHKEIIKSLYDMIDGKMRTDYRHIHLLYEHKRLILGKLEYIEKNLDTDIFDTIDKYRKVLKKTEIAKSLYLKGIITESEGSIYDPLKNEKLIRKIIKLLEDILADEPVVLQEFINTVRTRHPEVKSTTADKE